MHIYAWTVFLYLDEFKKCKFRFIYFRKLRSMKSCCIVFGRRNAKHGTFRLNVCCSGDL